MNSVQQVFRESIKNSVALIDGMTAGMSDEELHWRPPGTAHPVSAIYAHAALATDGQLNALFQGGQPAYLTEWEGRSGVSEPNWGQTYEWAQRLRVDRPAFAEYAKAIYAGMDAYIAGLSDEDLARTIDLSVIGSEPMSLAWCLSTLVVGHLNQLAGEIAAVKGAQGLKGYPF